MKINFNDAQQAIGFITPQLYNVETEVYQIKFPEFDYASFIPVVTEGSEWARGTLFRSSETVGEAKFISGKAFDMPYANSVRNQHLKGFEMLGIGFEWGLEELQVAALEGRNLSSEGAADARLVAESKLYDIATVGDTEKGWTGFVNDGNVTSALAPNDGTGSARTYASKSTAQVLRDLNAGIIGITSDTRETEMADTVVLPTSVLQALASRFIDGTSESILGWLLRNNAYTMLTGRPLTIRGMRALETAGASSSTRQISYRRDPRVLRFHLPMPHKFLPPFQKSSMTWEVAGIMRTGGTEIRLPKSVRYLDGI